MNWLDVLIVLPLVFGLIRGLTHGLISEIIAFVVVILGVLGSWLAAPPFSAWLLKQFAWPEEVCEVVAYVLVFLAIAIVLSVLAKLLNNLLKAIHLGWANRLLGGAFGVLKYGLLALVVIFIMDKTNEAFHWLDEAPIVKTSVLYPHAVQIERAVISVAFN